MIERLIDTIYLSPKDYNRLFKTYHNAKSIISSLHDLLSVFIYGNIHLHGGGSKAEFHTFINQFSQNDYEEVLRSIFLGQILLYNKIFYGEHKEEFKKEYNYIIQKQSSLPKRLNKIEFEEYYRDVFKNVSYWSDLKNQDIFFYPEKNMLHCCRIINYKIDKYEALVADRENSSYHYQSGGFE